MQQLGKVSPFRRGLIVLAIVVAVVAIVAAVLMWSASSHDTTPPTNATPTAPPAAEPPTVGPDALRPLEQTYPSVWTLIGSEPAIVPGSPTELLFAQDGSVWTTDIEAGRIGRVEASGDVTWVVEGLATDNAQEWRVVAADGDWLAYADTAVMHRDGPSLGPGLLLFHIPSGDTVLVVEREFAELEEWGEHGSWAFPSQSRFADGRLWWVDNWTSGGDLTDQRLMSVSLRGGEASEHHRDAFLILMDQECVSDPSAVVRLLSYPESALNDNEPPGAHFWEFSATADPVQVTPWEGLQSSLSEAQVCGATTALTRFETLDGSPMPTSFSWSEGDPAMMVNALEFTTGEHVLALHVDNDAAGSWGVSMTGDWAVVAVDTPGIEQVFVAVNTATDDVYEITAPTGTSIAYAHAVHGHLVVALGSEDGGNSGYIRIPLT